jgi:hypothetical protein
MIKENNYMLKPNSTTTKAVSSWSVDVPKDVIYHHSIINVTDDIKIDLISETTTKTIEFSAVDSSKSTHLSDDKVKNIQDSLKRLQSSIDKLF